MNSARSDDESTGNCALYVLGLMWLAMLALFGRDFIVRPSQSYLGRLSTPEVIAIYAVLAGEIVAFTLTSLVRLRSGPKYHTVAIVLVAEFALNVVIMVSLYGFPLIQTIKMVADPAGRVGRPFQHEEGRYIETTVSGLLGVDASTLMAMIFVLLILVGTLSLLWGAWDAYCGRAES